MRRVARAALATLDPATEAGNFNRALMRSERQRLLVESEEEGNLAGSARAAANDKGTPSPTSRRLSLSARSGQGGAPQSPRAPIFSLARPGNPQSPHTPRRGRQTAGVMAKLASVASPRGGGSGSGGGNGHGTGNADGTSSGGEAGRKKRPDSWMEEWTFLSGS